MGTSLDVVKLSHLPGVSSLTDLNTDYTVNRTVKLGLPFYTVQQNSNPLHSAEFSSFLKPQPPDFFLAVKGVQGKDNVTLWDKF